MLKIKKNIIWQTIRSYQDYFQLKSIKVCFFTAISMSPLKINGKERHVNECIYIVKGRKVPFTLSTSHGINDWVRSWAAVGGGVSDWPLQVEMQRMYL